MKQTNKEGNLSPIYAIVSLFYATSICNSTDQTCLNYFDETDTVSRGIIAAHLSDIFLRFFLSILE